MPDTPTELLGAALVLLILMSAFFSSAETGIISLDRYRLKHLCKHSRAARVVSAMLERPDRLISLILLGNNAVNILASIIGAVLFTRLFGDAFGIWGTTLVLTPLFLVFAEVTPKTIAVLRPERIAFAASYVLQPLMYIMGPLITMLNGITNRLVRLFRLEPTRPGRRRLNADELRTVIGDLSGPSHNMLLNVLDLKNIRVRDIMVPRGEVRGLDLNGSDTQLRKYLLRGDYTRLPVYKGDIDNIVGVLHKKHMGRAIAAGQVNADSIRKKMRKPYFVPGATSLAAQLLAFQKQRRRIGFVVDEYGAIQGLLTLDDLLEEIVGEYTTSLADPQDTIMQGRDGSYSIDASLTVREINRHTDLQLPKDGPKTLGGLIMETLETMPCGPVCVRLNGYRMEADRVDAKAIRRVRIRRA